MLDLVLLLILLDGQTASPIMPLDRITNAAVPLFLDELRPRAGAAQLRTQIPRF